ncbi:hypothetical protein, partial [Streptomyces sp. NPDC059256]|uniref:hypothetical protein n=1 Tax=Streptomyces sp. NPDC059256 TaxID=3346794 RepID=UPI00368B7784
PVNVSTHTGSARNTPPIQAKCPEQSLLQHPLALAWVEEVIAPLPAGAESRVGEAGAVLSGGERPA